MRLQPRGHLTRATLRERWGAGFFRFNGVSTEGSSFIGEKVHDSRRGILGGGGGLGNQTRALAGGEG